MTEDEIGYNWTKANVAHKDWTCLDNDMVDDGDDEDCDELIETSRTNWFVLQWEHTKNALTETMGDDQQDGKDFLQRVFDACPTNRRQLVTVLPIARALMHWDGWRDLSPESICDFVCPYAQAVEMLGDCFSTDLAAMYDPQANLMIGCMYSFVSDVWKREIFLAAPERDDSMVDFLAITRSLA